MPGARSWLTFPRAPLKIVHMDRTSGQSGRTNRRRDDSTSAQPTRQRLLDAAAALIAELGWGQVTTRAIAERAGLPHGAVSYHFQGKQELLTEAALQTVERLFPVDELAAIKTLGDLLPLVQSWLSAHDSTSSAGADVLIEAMREAKRNPALRHRLALILREYRQVVAELARAEQLRGAIGAGFTPSALATLIAAVGDGLLLHLMLDPELNTADAAATLFALLRA